MLRELDLPNPAILCRCAFDWEETPAVDWTEAAVNECVVLLEMARFSEEGKVEVDRQLSGGAKIVEQVAGHTQAA